MKSVLTGSATEVSLIMDVSFRLQMYKRRRIRHINNIHLHFLHYFIENDNFVNFWVGLTEKMHNIDEHEH